MPTPLTIMVMGNQNTLPILQNNPDIKKINNLQSIKQFYRVGRRNQDMSKIHQTLTYLLTDNHHLYRTT